MHKLSKMKIIISLLVVLAPVNVFADPVPAETLPLAARNVQVNLKPGSVDDQLIQMARVGGMNFIAEANELTAAPSKVAGEAQGKFATLLAYFSRENGLALSTLDTGKGVKGILDPPTIMLWPGCDIVGVARRITTGEPINKLTGTLTDDDFFKILAAYLVQVHHWDIYKPDFKTQFKVADLPPVLRQEMSARIQTELLRHTSRNIDWLQPEAWQKGTVTLGTSGRTNPRPEFFFSPGEDKGSYGYILPKE